MAKTVDAISADLTAWIEAQPMFFVATAPTGPDGHVNVSPKGGGTLRVVGPTAVAYLDLTGSGVETIAHLRDDGRITLMLCAFEGKAKILRLFGRGEVLLRASAAFEELAGRFGPGARATGVRSIITVALDRIQTSCGFGVPLMDLVGPRDELDRWAERKGPEGIVEYWTNRNARSIDGLPGLEGWAP
jgi:hypothetical protein